MKGIKLCGECGNYDYKKHRCRIGCKDDSDAQASFYCDCPLPDVVPKSEVENIFAEIETCMKDFEDDDDGYLLKKCEFEFFMREIKEKYAGQKNG